MKTRDIVLLSAAAVAAVVLFSGSLYSRIMSKLRAFIPSVEGFRSNPYWDESRYSWGYGTAAPGPTGTITRGQAMAELLQHVATDYAYLSPLITRPLSVNQWAALLSFSYNLGPGNADNLVPYINSGDDTALYSHFSKYVYAGGVVSSTLVDRRQKEWALWNS